MTATEELVPRTEKLALASPQGLPIRLVDDPYSDRIRCDHPSSAVGGKWLAKTLRSMAERRERGRIVVIAGPAIAHGLRRQGFVVEGRMPGFYRGEDDALVLGAYPDSARSELGWADDVATVQELLDAQSPSPPRRSEVETIRATQADAEVIAEMLAETFAQYPTPSSDPAYIEDAIAEGTPFRMVEVDGEVVACASADLVRGARTAELTDCATDPAHRGNGYMQAILLDLMDDLRDLNYPTAFTLARARIPGMNLAFQRLGFNYCGTMPQSCRIGDGIEDMNIWARPLSPISA